MSVYAPSNIPITSQDSANQIQEPMSSTVNTATNTTYVGTHNTGSTGSATAAAAAATMNEEGFYPEDNCKIPSSWDPQDDILLRHLKEIKKLGWKDIAQYFKNRTPNACQFRWRRLKSGSLKHKSVACTMELTDHDLENVIIPELPEPSLTSTSSSTFGSGSIVDENLNNGKPIRTRKPRTSSMVSHSTLKKEGNVTLSNHVSSQSSGMHNFIPQQQQQQHHSSLASVGFPKPRTYSTSSVGSLGSSISKHIHSFEQTQHLQQQQQQQQQQQGAGFDYQQQHSGHAMYQQYNTPLQHQAPQQSAQTFIYLPPPSNNLNPHVVKMNDEKHGFIPKVLVRSRRGSSVSGTQHQPVMVTSAPASTSVAMMPSGSSSSSSSHLQPPQQQQQQQQELYEASNHSSSTFNTSKSRKNSFSSRSRTGSFHTAPNERRMSVLLTEKDLMNGTDENGSTKSSSRRSSISVGINRKRDSYIKSTQMHHSTSSNGYSKSFGSHPTNDLQKISWSSEEDKVLMNGSLHKDEISILLTNRSDAEIEQRFNELQNEMGGSTGTKKGNPLGLVSEDPYSAADSMAVDSDGTPSFSKNISPSPPIFSEQDKESGTSVASSTWSNSNTKSRLASPNAAPSGSYKNRNQNTGNMITPSTSSSPNLLNGDNNSVKSPHSTSTLFAQHFSHKKNRGVITERNSHGSVTSNKASTELHTSSSGLSNHGSSPTYSDEDAIIDDDSDENITISTLPTNEVNYMENNCAGANQIQRSPQQIFNARKHTLPSLNSIFKDML